MMDINGQIIEIYRVESAAVRAIKILSIKHVILGDNIVNLLCYIFFLGMSVCMRVCLFTILNNIQS